MFLKSQNYGNGEQSNSFWVYEGGGGRRGGGADVRG